MLLADASAVGWGANGGSEGCKKTGADYATVSVIDTSIARTLHGTPPTSHSNGRGTSTPLVRGRVTSGQALRPKLCKKKSHTCQDSRPLLHPSIARRMALSTQLLCPSWTKLLQEEIWCSFHQTTTDDPNDEHPQVLRHKPDHHLINLKGASTTISWGK